MNSRQIRFVLKQLNELFVECRIKNPNFIYGSLFILLLSFLFFRLCIIIPLILLFFAGFILGLLVLKPNSLCPNFIWIYCRDLKNKKSALESKSFDSSCHVCGKKGCGRHRSELNIQTLQPWIDVTVPEKVNNALEEFLNLVLKEYINSWYRDLSDDESLTDEIKSTLRFAISTVIRRLRKVDLASFISQKVLKLSMKHLHCCLKVLRRELKSANKNISTDVPTKQSSSSSPPSTSSSSSPPSTSSSSPSLSPTSDPPSILSYSSSHENVLQHLEQTILEAFGHNLHCACRTRRSELDYLKQVTEQMFNIIMPPMSLKSGSCYALLKELFTGVVMLSAMDVVADPDIINNLLVLFFDESPIDVSTDPPSPQVPILLSFSQKSSNQQQYNKNLQLKLSTVLTDPELLYPFMQFMKAEASVNVLQFYLVIEEFNQKVLTPELTEVKLNELHMELCKLYDNYFNPTAHDCIRFDDDVVSQIKNICEGPAEGVKQLQTTTPLFRAYEHAYDLLEHNFLPLFHQSDIYYTMLCGERIPCTLQRKDSSKSSKRFSASGSLLKLSNRLKGAFRSSAVDGRPLVDDIDYDADEVEDALMSEDNIMQVATNNTTNINNLTGCNLTNNNNTNSNVLLPNKPDGSAYQVLPTDDSFILTTSPNDPADQQQRDLSLWAVSIPCIVTKADPSDPNNVKKFSYAFQVDVRRLGDDKEVDFFEQENWIIERRYHEFYVLENKLKEFHGEFDDCQLPAKKTFVPKSRMFFETLRPEFESFLRILLTKPNLRGSQLVHGFLTSNQEFTTSFLDVNLGKKMKSGAMKLVKERGQHLEPFLKNFLQSTESIRSKPSNKPVDRDADTLSISSEKMINSIYNNNANIEDLPYAIVDVNVMVAAEEGDNIIDGDVVDGGDDRGDGDDNDGGVSFVDNITSYFDALLYLCHSIYESPDWLMQMFLSVRMLLRNTMDTFLDWYLNRKLHQMLQEQYIVKLIQMLRDALFFDNDPPRSDEDKKERQKHAFRDLLNYIPNIFIQVIGSEKHEQGTKLLFDVLQQPRLNKHLSYTLLDAVLEELFPELLSDSEVASVLLDNDQHLVQLDHSNRSSSSNLLDMRKRNLKSI